MQPSYVDLQPMNEINFVYFLLAVFLTVAAVGCKPMALTLTQRVLGDTCGAYDAQNMGTIGCGSLHHLDMQNGPKILAEEAQGESL